MGTSLRHPEWQALGAVVGTLAHLMVSGGERDFVSDTTIAAGRYEIQVDDSVAGEAERLLRDARRTMSPGRLRRA